MDFKLNDWIISKEDTTSIWQIVREHTSEKGTKTVLLCKNGCSPKLSKTWFEYGKLVHHFRHLTPIEYIMHCYELCDNNND